MGESSTRLVKVLVRMLPLAYAVARPPIVMVPGLAGSVFRARLHHTAKEPHVWCWRDSDWFVTWLNVGELLPEQKDCLLWRLMPTYNATDATYHDRAGVELDTNVDFGGVGGIAYLAPSLRASGYFSTMISFFEAMGYTAGVNLHGAPYDWRAAPDGHSAPGAYYEQLQRLVEATVERNGGAKAALVTHSLGGPTTLAFLLSRPAGWVASHISCFVPISAPWAGATRQALADISGDNFGIPFVPADYLKPVQAAAASGVFLLPSSAAFGDRVIVSAAGRNYSAADMQALLSDLKLTQALAVRDNLERLKWNLEFLRAPPVRTLAVSSKGVPTEERYVYTQPLSPNFDGLPSHVESGDGDGTVNLISLRWAQDGGWSTGDGVERQFVEVHGVSHFDMVKNATVLTAVAAFINASHQQATFSPTRGEQQGSTIA